MNFTQQLWSVKEWGRVMATGSEYVTIVHEATNEDKWGPTGPQMDAVCNAYSRGGAEILSELRSRLNNRDKAWRPCYKSLLVIDYLARNVGDRYLPEICALVPLLRTISTSFYYTNPKGIDHGVSVRERAKKLADLLSDGLQLREERVVAAQTKEKLSHNASEGGGPNNFGAYGGSGNGYGGAYGGGYDRYGGSGPSRDRYGGSAGSQRRDPYSSFGSGSSGGNGRPSYDAYRTSPPAQATPSRPRSKEEQERYDMEMALRMQRDEERRAGVSAEQLEEMYATKVRQRHAETERQKAAANDDEALARRLQEEEEDRARREGRALPTLNSDRPSATPAKAAAATPAPVAPAPPAQPEANALDDLFAPAPAAPAAPAAAAPPADPFDAFLDSRSAPQPQPQQQSPWGQPQPQPQQPPAQMPQNAWGQPQPQPQPQQPNGAWGAPSAPSPQQQQQPAANPWGQPVSAPPSNAWAQPQMSGSYGQQQQQPPQQQQWGQFQQQASPSQPPMSNNGSASAWGQPAVSQQQPPQQQQPQDPWGQFQQQPQQSGGWGQPAPQQSGTWGQPPPSAATTTARASSSANPGADLDSMWGTLNQFANQQQRK